MAGDDRLFPCQDWVAMSKSISAEVLSGLIGSAYDCALDPERWPMALKELHEALNFRDAMMALMALPSGQPLLVVAHGVEPYWLERATHYGEDIVGQWGGPEAFSTFPLHEPAVLSRIQPRAAIEANRYYREWSKPQGLIDVMGLQLARDATTHGSIGLSRHRSAGKITEGEIEAARLMIPHFQRAVAISKALDLKTIAAASFAAALDVVLAPVFLVDAALHIVHANQAAEAILRTGDPVASADGALALQTSSAQAALELVVRQAAAGDAAVGGHPFGISVLRDDGTPAVLHVLPLRHGDLRPGLEPAAVAAVFVAPVAISLPTGSSAALAALFELTAAEARIFTGIAAGKTLAETAQGLGIGESTARTHLLRVFDKTGTRRQAELVKLAGSFALPV